MNKLLKIVSIVLIFTLLGFGITYAIVTLFFPNIGNLILSEKLEVWLDGTQIHDGDVIDWGDVYQGDLIEFSNFTIKNTGHVALKVSLEIEKTIPQGWILTWAQNKTTISAHAQATAPLILSIPTNATTFGTWGFAVKGEQ